MTTIAAKRIETFVAQAAALGCKVADETKADGERVVMVTGAHWADRDSVFVTYTPASAKDGSNRRDSLFCMIFSDARYPRKGRAVVEFHQAVSYLGMLKDYSAHAHCEPARHVCHEATCTALRDGEVCGMAESLHRQFRDLLDHPFTTETA